MRLKEHWKNLSLNNIIEKIDGDVYTEKWVDIINYEGLYQISSFGRIKSMNRIVNTKDGHKKHLKSTVLKQYIRDSGYLKAAISKDCRLKTFDIHRLVGIYFVPNPEKKPEVNHKKGVKTDNRAVRLEWSTSSENAKHKFDIGLQKGYWSGKKGKNHHASKEVIQYDMSMNFIKKWDCVPDICRSTGFSNSTIYACCEEKERLINGVIYKRKSAFGFIWKYA